MIVRDLADGVEILAPAKLNLFLEILGRRSDGYHEIESLMVAVNLHDTLSVTDDASGAVALSCDDPTIPTGRDNLVVKAAERLKAATGCPRGASVVLRKAIPAQAGLGGGSVCRGRGERVLPAAMREPLHFVLVCPTVGMSTAEVYRTVTPPERPRPIGPVLEALARGKTADLGRCLFNRLQPAAEALRPELIGVRDALSDLHPSDLDGTLMSGSGSAYFGLARDLSAARDAAGSLQRLGAGCVRVVTCGT